MTARYLSIRLLATGLIVLLLATFIPARSSAGARTVVLTAMPALGGVSRVGGYNALKVMVRGVGSPVEGTLEVSSWEWPGVTWSSRFSVGPGPGKTYTIYARASSGNQVRAISQSGEVLNEVSVSRSTNPAREGSLTGITVSRYDRVPVFLSELVPLGTSYSQPSVLHAVIPVSDLPDHWLGLDGVGFVLFADVKLDDIPSVRVRALRTWLLRGGSLIVCGGRQPGRLTRSSFHDWLPVTLVDQTLEVPLFPALDSFFPDHGQAPGQVHTTAVVPQASIRPRAQLIAQSGGIPLLARWSVGAGEVIYVAWDIERESLLPANEGRQILWRSILPDVTRMGAADRGRESGSATASRDLQRMGLDMDRVWAYLTREGRHDLPILELMLFAVTYFLVIGPIQYLVLARRRSFSSAWWSTPGIAIMFTLIAFGMGYRRYGSRASAVKIEVRESFEGVGEVLTHSLLQVFSGFEAEFDVVPSPCPALVEPQIRNSPAYGRRTSSTARVQMESGSVYPVQDPIRMWSSRAYFGLALESFPGVAGVPRITFQDRSTERLAGTIFHPGPRTLHHVHLISGSSFLSLGELQPGEERRFSGPWAAMTQGPVGDSPSIANLEGDSRFWARLASAEAPAGLKLVAIEDPTVAPTQGSGSASLDSGAPSIRLSPTPEKEEGLRIVVHHLGPGRESSGSSVAPHQVRYRAEDGGNLWPHGIQVPPEGVVIDAFLSRFPCPEGIGRVRYLSVFVDHAAAALSADLFDPGTEQWVSMPPFAYGQGSSSPMSRFGTPDRFMTGPRSQVRLRIRATAGVRPGVSPFETLATIQDLGLEAELENVAETKPCYRLPAGGL